MVDAAVHVIRVGDIPNIFFHRVELRKDRIVRINVASQTENTGARGKNRVPLRRLLRILRFAEVTDDDFFQRVRYQRIILQQAVPVGIHAEKQRLVIQ